MPTAVSCRSGAVVHLLAANGTKVPVTLKMSVKEAADSKHSLHIVQVNRQSLIHALSAGCGAPLDQVSCCSLLADVV